MKNSRWKEKQVFKNGITMADLDKEVESDFKECCAEGWDGYSAEPVSIDACLNTKFFISILPLDCDAPEVAPCNDGWFDFDWINGRKSFCLSLDLNNVVSYAYLYDSGISGCGKFKFERFIPGYILSLIYAVFDKSPKLFNRSYHEIRIHSLQKELNDLYVLEKENIDIKKNNSAFFDEGYKAAALFSKKHNVLISKHDLEFHAWPQMSKDPTPFGILTSIDTVYCWRNPLRNDCVLLMFGRSQYRSIFRKGMMFE